MSYALLIIEPTGQRATRSLDEGRAVYARMQDFAQELAAQGRLAAVESLAGPESAQRVGRVDGATRIVDGPYAEAKEMVGGIFLLRGVTHDEALAIAARCPAAEWAAVEVRAMLPCYDNGRA